MCCAVNPVLLKCILYIIKKYAAIHSVYMFCKVNVTPTV
jgi:hypothetical protein